VLRRRFLGHAGKLVEEGNGKCATDAVGVGGANAKAECSRGGKKHGFHGLSPARRSYQTVNESGSPHLPGLRETVLDAEATSEDRSSTDAAGVPAALGTASIVPDGCTILCKKTIDPGEEDWAGKEEYRGAEKGRKEDDWTA
jgi:hypothetical protein